MGTGEKRLSCKGVDVCWASRVYTATKQPKAGWVPMPKFEVFLAQ